jgi:hypothetical protein
MVRTFIAALALAALPAAAFAEPERITDASYIPATRCAALAELPALAADPLDVTALREALLVGQGTRTPYLRERAREEERRARLLARRTENADLLRIRRDTACAPFVARGLASATGGGGGQHAAPSQQ